MKTGYLPRTAPPAMKSIGVMIFGCIAFNRVSSSSFVDGNIDAKNYEEIL